MEEIVWLPKAIGKSQDFKLPLCSTLERNSLDSCIHPAAFEVKTGIITLYARPLL
jgi:hypothetical protein